MSSYTTMITVLAVILAGAIFGFFYAWLCSTMWGLDEIDPRMAITAMQAINARVQNVVFFPAFFLTPAALAVAAIFLTMQGFRQVALWFVAATIVYIVLGMGVTLFGNVPMNEKLAATPVPDDLEQARAIWQDYSRKWQQWNLIRTIGSGLSLALAAFGLTRLSA
ncbi:MAG: DUF1772 domain-containing protein [Sphingomonadaceae bacterium]